MVPYLAHTAAGCLHRASIPRFSEVVREFVTAYANEFVAERESALDLGSRLGREVRGRFRVEVSSEVLEVAERRDFRRARS